MSATLVETIESRTPDGEGWLGVPFRHPRDLGAAQQGDGGKHDGGPMPPEAPRDPQPGDDDKVTT